MLPDDRNDNEQFVETEPSIGDLIAETMTSAATLIPPQAQRSFWKAVGRVFVAGAEWPAKVLEGKARIAAARANVSASQFDVKAAELRARQKAREVVLRASAKSAADRFSNPEMADRALQFHVEEMMREQAIREEVMLLTAENLQSDPPKNDSKMEIDDDWLTSFLKQASTRSSEEYKSIFGRILAGEIRHPGTFSIGTVQLLAKLDAATADLFYKACNISTIVYGAPKLISENFAPAGTNGLLPFGLMYESLARLIEAGLLRSEFSEQIEIIPEHLNTGITFLHSNSTILLKSKSVPNSQTNSLALIGPSFTRSGAELRQVVSMELSREYLSEFAKWLGSQNVELSFSVSEGCPFEAVPILNAP